MPRIINEYGKCVICDYYAEEVCLNCDMFVCEEHKILIPYEKPTVKAKTFCQRCVK